VSLSVDGFWKSGFWTQTFWADGFWYEGPPIPPVTPTAATFSGGWGAYSRYRDEKEVRDERIARGIIPPDEPEAETLIEASKQSVPLLARRKLRQLAEGQLRLAELDRMLTEIMQAQRKAEERAYTEMLTELRRAQGDLKTMNNQTAILIMLGLL
jgi:hypothetical protein